MVGGARRATRDIIPLAKEVMPMSDQPMGIASERAS